MNEPAIPTLESSEEALEQELRSFRLAAVSPGLKDRIRLVADEWKEEPEADLGKDRQELIEKAVILRFHPGWMSAAAAAVIVAAGAVWWARVPPAGPAAPAASLAAAQPAAAEPAGDTGRGPVIWDRPPAEMVGGAASVDPDPNQVLVGQSNDGIIHTQEGRAMWKVRYYLLHVTEVPDPATGQMRELLVPEERVIMIPVMHD